MFLLLVLISLFWILSSSLLSFLSDLHTGELGKPSPSELIVERLVMCEGHVSETLVLMARNQTEGILKLQKKADRSTANTKCSLLGT